MKYAIAQDWAVHASTLYYWSLIGDTPGTTYAQPPGTVGFSAGTGGYLTFDECVKANQLLSPLDFEFPGGRLGLWLYDLPYSDNQGGPDGRAPSWKVTCVQ